MIISSRNIFGSTFLMCCTALAMVVLANDGKKTGMFTFRDGKIVPLYADRSHIEYSTNWRQNIWMVPPERHPSNLTEFLEFVKVMKPAAVVFQDAPFVRPITDIEPAILKMFDFKTTSSYDESIRFIPADDFHSHLFHRLGLMLHVLQSCASKCFLHQKEYDKAFVDLRWTIDRASNFTVDEQLESKPQFVVTKPATVRKARVDALAKRSNPWKIPLDQNAILRLSSGPNDTFKPLVIQAMYWCLGVIRRNSVVTSSLVDEAVSRLSKHQDVLLVADKIRNDYVLSLLHLFRANDIILLDFTRSRAYHLFEREHSQNTKLFYLQSVWDDEYIWYRFKEIWRFKPSIQNGVIQDASLRGKFVHSICLKQRPIWILPYEISPSRHSYANIAFAAQQAGLTDILVTHGVDESNSYFPALLLKLATYAFVVSTSISGYRPKDEITSYLTALLHVWESYRQTLLKNSSSQLNSSIVLSLNTMRRKLRDEPGSMPYSVIFDVVFETFIWSMSELTDIQNNYWTTQASQVVFALPRPRFVSEFDSAMVLLSSRLDELLSSTGKESRDDQALILSIVALSENYECFESILRDLSSYVFAQYMQDVVLRDSDSLKPVLLLLHSEWIEQYEKVFDNHFWLVQKPNDHYAAKEEFQTYANAMKEYLKWAA